MLCLLAVGFADAVAKAIQKAARSSYRLPKTVNDSVNQVLSISISSIRASDSQIKEFDKAIAAQLNLIPNTLQSIKGIGPVYAAGIIAEIGDINRFLKYYLGEAALSLVKCDTEYKNFYHLKYKEVNKYQHKRALALTVFSNSLLTFHRWTYLLHPGISPLPNLCSMHFLF